MTSVKDGGVNEMAYPSYIQLYGQPDPNPCNRDSSHRRTMQNDSTTPQGEESNFEERTSFAAYLLRDYKFKEVLSCTHCNDEPDRERCFRMGYPKGCLFFPEE